MRSFLLMAKITLFFATLAALLLGGALLLFMRVAGHEMLDELSLLRAHQGLSIALEAEPLLEEHGIDGDPLEAFLASEQRRRAIVIRLEQGERIRDLPKSLPRSHHFHSNQSLMLAGRQCYLVGPPQLESWVPLQRNGETVAYLVVHGPYRIIETHRAFFTGLLQIGLLGLLSILALAFYLTRPLQRMSRSMDRVAAGDLEHRVAVRGRDEVAAMGRSFNTMADRIRDMVMGQKELMAGVSHELRSPLARMKLSLELLRAEPEKRQAERLRELEEEVDAIDELVGELLHASRFDLGATRLDLEAVDLKEVTEQAWERVSQQAADRELILELRLATDATDLQADRKLLTRVLGNLFENAVRYAGQGQVCLSSRSLLIDGKERVELTVSDQGPGVPAEHLPRLFEPFYRADRSRSRKTGASGLGLMIVQRAVEAHGGRIEAEANHPMGLTIRFDLPGVNPV